MNARRVQAIADRAIRRRATGDTWCRSCSRPMPSTVAERMMERLQNLGVSDETLEKHAPLCNACMRRVVDLATAIRDGAA